ncbi:hypothetical protein KAU33_13025 [Candidatus Dependentiae bacterium]|nr:hypothetical protein [Candidatus Dependentiae bacterium]
MKFKIVFVIFFVFITLPAFTAVKKIYVYSEPEEYKLTVQIKDSSGKKVGRYDVSNFILLKPNHDNLLEVFYKNKKLDSIVLKRTITPNKIVSGILFFPTIISVYSATNIYMLEPERSNCHFRIKGNKIIHFFSVNKDNNIFRASKKVKYKIIPTSNITDINKSMVLSMDLTSLYFQSFEYYMYADYDNVFLFVPKSFKDSFDFNRLYTYAPYKIDGFTRCSANYFKLRLNIKLQKDWTVQYYSNIRKSSFKNDWHEEYIEYYCNGELQKERLIYDSRKYLINIQRFNFLKRKHLKWKIKGKYDLYFGPFISYYFNNNDVIRINWDTGFSIDRKYADFNFNQRLLNIGGICYFTGKDKYNEMNYFLTMGKGFYNGERYNKLKKGSYFIQTMDSNNINYFNFAFLVKGCMNNYTNEMYFGFIRRFGSYRYSEYKVSEKHSGYGLIKLNEYGWNFGTKMSSLRGWSQLGIRYTDEDIHRIDRHRRTHITYVEGGVGFNFFEITQFYGYGKISTQHTCLDSGLYFKLEICDLYLNFYNNYIDFHSLNKIWDTEDLWWYKLRGYELKIKNYKYKDITLDFKLGFYLNYAEDYYNSPNVYDNEDFKSYSFSLNLGY